MAKYYCEYCGASASTVSGLTANSCSKHPAGSYKGRHSLYQGTEKQKYTCKFCGTNASSISGLTANSCSRHPNGSYKGYHSPAL